MKTPNKCRHFNGTVNEECKAGVRYADYDVEQCLGRASGKCELCECFTDEERQVQRERMKTAMRNVAIARKSIIDVLDDNPGDGEMPCPVCHSGTLCYSKASNGHVSGFCTSKNCVNWME